MVIQQPAFAFPFADVSPPGARRRRLSRATTIAIGASIAVHIGIGLYLLTWTFQQAQIATPPDRPMIGTVITWPKPRPDRPITPPPTPVHRSISTTPPIDTLPVRDLPKTPIISKIDATTTVLGGSGQATEVPVVQQLPHVTKIINPTWIAKPDAEQMQANYPDRAIRMGLGGKVSMNCVVAANGSVGQCVVNTETPANMGFGDAARRLAKYFRMSPRTVDGQPTDGAIVSIPLSFGLSGQER
jgi:protein TonB